jgi:hypothetical protein
MKTLLLYTLASSFLCLTACQNGKLTPQGEVLLTKAEDVAITAGTAAGEAAIAGKIAGESNAQIKAEAIKAALQSTRATSPAAPAAP